MIRNLHGGPFSESVIGEERMVICQREGDVGYVYDLLEGHWYYAGRCCDGEMIDGIEGFPATAKRREMDRQ